MQRTCPSWWFRACTRPGSLPNVNEKSGKRELASFRSFYSKIIGSKISGKSALFWNVRDEKSDAGQQAFLFVVNYKDEQIHEETTMR